MKPDQRARKAPSKRVPSLAANSQKEAAPKSRAPERKRRVAKVTAAAKAAGIKPPKVTTAPERTGPGRPTDYRPEYVDFILECADRGMSLEATCGVLGIEHKTLMNWGAAHSEFLQAIGVAKMKRVAFLEAEAMLLMNGPAIGLRMRTLANLAPESWKERHEIGLGGTPGAPPIAVKHDDSSAMACYMRAIETAGKAVDMPPKPAGAASGESR